VPSFRTGAVTEILSERAGFQRTRVDLGDGDDRLDVDAAEATVRGGPGNDTLTSRRTRVGKLTVLGEAGDDHLISGALDEELRGGPGDDTLEGGEGADRLDGGPGADRMDGGPGDFDVAYYAKRRDDVRVDLRQGTGGTAGEGDTLANLEGGYTGAGDDVLTGDDAANELISGRGRDRVDGRGGDDNLSTVGAARSIACGAGRDTAMAAQPETVIGADCELASHEDFVPARAQPLLRGRTALVDLRTVERGRGTRGTVSMTRGPRGAVLATGDVGEIWRDSALARVRLALTPAGRAYLRRPSGKVVTIRLNLRDESGRYTDAWSVRLR
jgi:Ca2+-binding RTX toxin-like protein